MVSVIIPVYNIKDYISNSVISVMNQTFKDIEIILVDDGSTDGCCEICDEYAGKDKRIKVIHKQNGGLSSARNAGLDIANGEYILFIDGDDYIALNSIEYLVHIQKETDADIIQFEYEETKEISFHKHIEFNEQYELIKDKKIFYERLYQFGGVIASACTKLYKKELFDTLRFKEGILHEDEYFVTRLFSLVQSIAYINEKLYYYVMRDDSIIRSEFSIKKLDYFLVRKDRIEILKELNYPDLLDIEYERYFSGLMNFYCKSIASRNKEGCKEIIKLINEYKTYEYTPKGKYRLFYIFYRINPHMVYIYYLLRKYFGHI